MGKKDKIRELQKYYSIFDEGFGTAYERYALNKFASQMVDKYNISSVLEMPADGVMGIPGINSLIFAKIGCDVTLAHPSEELLKTAKKIWDAFGLDADFVKSDWIDSKFKTDSFDLVWNFCVYGHFDNPDKVLHEMLRVTRKFIFIEVQNIINPGFIIHRFQHRLRKERWDHGDPYLMKLSDIKNIISELNVGCVKIGGIDMPPWPDIPIKIKDKISKKKPSISREINKNPTNKLRPPFELKDISQLIDDIYSFEKPSRKDEIVFRLFKVWHLLVESRVPFLFKKFFAHHISIIAEKI